MNTAHSSHQQQQSAASPLMRCGLTVEQGSYALYRTVIAHPTLYYSAPSAASGAGPCSTEDSSSPSPLLISAPPSFAVRHDQTIRKVAHVVKCLVMGGLGAYNMYSAYDAFAQGKAKGEDGWTVDSFQAAIAGALNGIAMMAYAVFATYYIVAMKSYYGLAESITRYMQATAHHQHGGGGGHQSGGAMYASMSSGLDSPACYNGECFSECDDTKLTSLLRTDRRPNGGVAGPTGVASSASSSSAAAVDASSLSTQAAACSASSSVDCSAADYKATGTSMSAAVAINADCSSSTVPAAVLYAPSSSALDLPDGHPMTLYAKARLLSTYGPALQHLCIALMVAAYSAILYYQVVAMLDNEPFKLLEITKTPLICLLMLVPVGSFARHARGLLKEMATDAAVYSEWRGAHRH